MDFPTPTHKYHHEPTPIVDPTQARLSAAGKIVLVTGGGTTIGASTVEAFAKAKAAHIFLAGRRVNLLEDVAKKLSSQYPETKFHSISSDIANEESVQSLFQEINKTGPLDILVANAGYLPTPATITNSETSDWWKGYEINTLGTYLLAKSFVTQSQKSKSTPIFIAVNTGAAHFGPGFGPMSSYAPSKLAGASIVEYLQFEHPDIKAFSVHPGMVASDMAVKAGFNGEDSPAIDSPKLLAHMAVWLAGPDSDFLKGRFLWANWDVEELVKAKEEIVKQPGLFRLTLNGWTNKL